MPRVNHTIDDRSPLIRYAPAGTWSLGSKTGDPLASRYSNNGTFTLCTTAGSSATFTFNGTGIWIHGARRSNHGPYEVNLDNDVKRFDGFQAVEDFATPLFSADNLFDGLHTVSITNRRDTSNARPFLDIDFITWTAEVQNASASQVVIPHTAGAFQYEPASAWNQPVSAGFNSTTAHFTTTTNAEASLTFTGSAISVFGAVSGTTAPYSVQLDHRPAQNFDGRVNEYTPQTMLYFADNLGPGSHTLKMVNLPAAEGQGLLLDYALVADGGSETPTTTDTSSGGLSSGVIAGIAVGAVALLASFVLAFFFWRKTAGRSKHASMVIEDRPLPPNSLVYTPFTMGSTTQSELLPPSERPSAPSTSERPSNSIYPRSSMSQVSSAGGSRPLYTANPSESDSPRERSYPASVSTHGYYPPDSKRSMVQLSHTADQTPYFAVPDMEESPPSYDHASHRQ
ncbi:hypothetical protein CCMSSC00406_0003570 [Pleurotus cornucopiae]|uniref:Uncharacterized protein n=1 Tax=Pleurotus cornucopiae TaxID=5321 RepID=A0ACB7IIP5_PLECO|nr:hypothetical protein CCMSSC00406_0003570 [Pleurotus cornucopiae]